MRRNIFEMDFFDHPWLWKVFLAAALLASFGLRMINLQDPPLDFASTRQLFSALKARGIYYEYVTNVPEATRNQAISLGDVGIVEPPLLENIVAQTYRLTGEHLWIARIYSSFFWVIAGLALFLLIREFASTSAAMIGTLFYLFVPFGVIASRAFMPDPLMVCLIIFTLWALFRWQNTASWKWAILFGIFAGAALFVKNLSSFRYRGRVCRGHPGGERPETVHPRPAGLDNGHAAGSAGGYLHALRDVEAEHGRTICLALLPQNVGRSGFLFSLGLYG